MPPCGPRCGLPECHGPAESAGGTLRSTTRVSVAGWLVLRWCVPSCVLSCLRSCVRFVACSRVCPVLGLRFEGYRADVKP